MEESWIDPIASWEVSVLDDFSGAVIVFKAIPPNGDETKSETYDLKSTGWTLSVLHRFRAEVEGLIAYMESGGKRLPSTRQ